MTCPRCGIALYKLAPFSGGCCFACWLDLERTDAEMRAALDRYLGDRHGLDSTRPLPVASSVPPAG